MTDSFTLDKVREITERYDEAKIELIKEQPYVLSGADVFYERIFS